MRISLPLSGLYGNVDSSVVEAVWLNRSPASDVVIRQTCRSLAWSQQRFYAQVEYMLRVRCRSRPLAYQVIPRYWYPKPPLLVSKAHDPQSPSTARSNWTVSKCRYSCEEANLMGDIELIPVADTPPLVVAKQTFLPSETTLSATEVTCSLSGSPWTWTSLTLRGIRTPPRLKIVCRCVSKHLQGGRSPAHRNWTWRLFCHILGRYRIRYEREVFSDRLTQKLHFR